MAISDKVADKLRGILREPDAASVEGPQTVVDAGPAGTLGGLHLEEVIGVGGMGTVYRAVDRATGKEVALKVPHAGEFPFSGRFERESEVAHVLGQVGDAPYLDHGVTSSGTPFLAMPLLSGDTLDDRLEAEGRIEAGEALRIAERVAHVLGGLHRRGLVHRDVKPGNVLVGDDRAVWLVDHGLTGTPQTLRGAGTPAYAAPEQIAGMPLSSAADVFGLGVMLLEMWLGEPVFESAEDRLANPDAANKLEKCEDPEVRALITKMLAEDAEVRPPSGEHVARALARLRVRGRHAERRFSWHALGLLGHTERVARQPELEALARRIEQAKEAFVVGPAGIGKSRLIAAWCAEHAGDEVTIGWPPESLSPHPRKPLEMAMAWLASCAGLRGAEPERARRLAIRELVMEIAPADVVRRIESSRPDSLAEGIVEALGALADKGGLVLVIPHDTPVDRQSLAILATLRSRHGAGVVAIHEMHAARGKTPLGPLDAGALRAMATGASDVDVERALRRAQGNPLAFQVFAVSDGETWEEALDAHLRGVDPYARWLLRLASLGGEVFDALTILNAAGACDGPAVRDGLERLVERGVLIDLTREVGAATGTYRFAHPAFAKVARRAWPASHVAFGTRWLRTARAAV